MSERKRFSLVRPTVGTCFHIDFDWWRQNDRDWRVYLRSNLCPEHREMYADVQADDSQVDWIDPDTAEVQQVDGLQHVLITHCAKQDGFLSEHTALVDAAFKIFLANGNMPLTVIELGEKLGRPPQTVLRTFSGSRVYKGIRPCAD